MLLAKAEIAAVTVPAVADPANRDALLAVLVSKSLYLEPPSSEGWQAIVRASQFEDEAKKDEKIARVVVGLVDKNTVTDEDEAESAGKS